MGSLVALFEYRVYMGRKMSLSNAVAAIAWRLVNINIWEYRCREHQVLGILARSRCTGNGVIMTMITFSANF